MDTIPVELQGVLPVISTPFTDSDEIDEAALGAELDWLIKAGVDGVVTGMVSEFLRMPESMRLQLTDAVVSAVDGRVATVMSVGSESIASTVRLTRRACDVGATGLMANPPLSASLGDDELFGYYATIAEHSGETPLVVQDASGYVGRPLSVALYLRLLDAFDPVKIQFKPETQPLGPRFAALHAHSDGKARIFEGTGGLNVVESHARGSVGTMPGPDLAWAIVALWSALQAGDAERADEIFSAVAPLLTHTPGLEAYVAVQKYLLVRQGVIPSARALAPNGHVLDDVSCSEIDRLFERIRVTVGRDGGGLS